MAKYRPKRLTDLFLRKKIKKPGRYTDGPGSNGLSATARRLKSGQLSISWCQRIRILRKVTTLGLGTYPKVSLREARQLASFNARAVQEGRDPRIGGKRTFEEIAIEYVDLVDSSGKWRKGSRSRQAWIDGFRIYVFPHIGHLPPDQITRAHIMQLLKPIWITINPTARKIAQRISRVMKYARAWGHCESDPAEKAIDGLSPVHLPTNHRKALHYSLLGEAIRIVAASDANPVAINALKFLTLTAVRSGEARKATWDQIDLENSVWTIPQDNVKNYQVHDVPLSEAAIRVLEDAAQLTGTRTGLVFPATRGGIMHPNSLQSLLSDNSIDAHVHGARTSFRTWASENGITKEAAEAVLAHKTRNPYLRTTLFQARIVIMNDWADYLNI